MPDEPRNERERGLVPVPDPTILTTEALRREVASLREYFDVSLSGIVNTFTARLDAMDEAQRLFQAGLSRVPSDTDKQVSQLAALHDERFESFDHRVQELGELQAEKFASVQTQFVERDTRFAQDAKTTRTAIDDALAASKEILDERFRSIQGQFQERDIRAEQTFISSKVAVDAALQAAKEAVGEQNRSSALAIAKSEAATDKRIDQIVALVSTATNAIDGKIVDIKDRLVRIEGAEVGASGQRAESHQTGGASVALIAVVVSVIAVIVSIVLFAMRTR